ncbi:MAG: hypothetical protein KAU01_11865 [Candidatus Cloacimonetes bacterium]|nr:hypothetical protein [Candidatus Cloacimonadota bacterium]
MEIVLAAFAGAFFSFLFVKLAENFSNIHDTKKLHYYSLLKIQTILTNHLDEIPANIEQVNSIINIEKETEKNIFITANKPLRIEFDQSVILNLKNSDITNELMLYICNLRRYNAVITNTNEIHSLLRNSLIQKIIGIDTYKRNFEVISSTFKDINNFLEELNIDRRRIFCMVRIRIQKDKTNIFKSIFHKLPDTNEDDFKDKVAEELKKLEKNS